MIVPISFVKFNFIILKISCLIQAGYSEVINEVKNGKCNDP
jgi:hypothetical protein